MTTRRKFLLAMATTLAAPPLARAQGKVRRIAWFGRGRVGVPSPLLAALQAGLLDLGWVEGRTLSITPHWSDGTPQDEERLTRQILASNSELIVAQGTDLVALRRAQPGIPVVFGFSGNPVDAGLVHSFARPGGNMTGISLMSLDMAGRRIELLKEIAPRIQRMGVLLKADRAGAPRERAVSGEVARKLGLTLVYIPIRSEPGISDAFRRIERQGCDSLLVFPDEATASESGQIGQYVIDNKLPAVSGWATFADDGFLLSYGPDLRDAFKRLARYVDRILRGSKPAALPVEQAKKAELVVNLKTAKALGLAVPQSILKRASRVIE